MKKLLLFIIILFAGYSSVFSQNVQSQEDVTISARASRMSVPLNYTVEVFIEVKWLGAQDRYTVDRFDNPTITGFQITGTSSSNVVEEVNGVVYSKKLYTYTLKPVELGMGYVDGAFLKYTGSETGESNTVVTQRIGIKVTNPVYERDYTFLIYIAGAVLILLIAGYYIYRNIQRKKERAAELLAAGQKTADIENELKEELKRYRPDVSADLNSFLHNISHLLYRYISHKFDVETAGLNKEEIVSALREENAEEGLVNSIGSFIERSDIYRFSGQSIDLSVYEQLYALVELIIERNIIQSPENRENE